MSKCQPHRHSSHYTGISCLTWLRSNAFVTFLTCVHVEGEPLDQFQDGPCFNDGDSGFGLDVLFEHNVLFRVCFSKSVQFCCRQPHLLLLLLLQHGCVQHTFQCAAILQRDQRSHPAVLLLSRLGGKHNIVPVLQDDLEGMPVLALLVVLIVDLDFAHEKLFFKPILCSGAGTRQPWWAVVGLTADHQAVKEEDVALVFGTHTSQRALHYELVAALADVLSLPAVDVLLDLVHLLDGEVLPLHLMAVETTRRLAAHHRRRERAQEERRTELIKTLLSEVREEKPI